MLRYDDFGAALIEVGDDRVAVTSLVGEQGAQLDPREEWCDTDSVEALPRQENEAHELAKRICQSEVLVVIPPLERPMPVLSEVEGA